jgi:hypothetical protein
LIFRRRKAEPDEAPASGTGEGAAQAADPRREGPWDRSETDADADDKAYVDLGGLIVKATPGLELRLQVDESSGLVAAVLFTGMESGLELRAFAAPRTRGVWEEVKHDIAAEAARRGGAATELQGAFGPELQVVVPAQTSDGRQGTQTSRIVGVDGPRWMLRGTFLGKSAIDVNADEVLDQAFRDVIVVRGDAPMAPRAVIAMRMPDQARSAWDDSDAEHTTHPAEQ